MYYVVAALFGMLVGGGAVFLCVLHYVQQSKLRDKTAQSLSRAAKEALAAVAQKEVEVDRDMQLRAAELNRLNAEAQQLHARAQARVVSYQELQEENAILKRDLQNLDVNLNKVQLDGEAREQRQAQIATSSTSLAKRYLAENVKAAVSAIGPSNFAACKGRLVDAIERVRDIGFPVSAEEETRLLADLKSEFEKAVRAEFERQEQARIKAQIREEEKLKREVERELQQLERERLAVQAALDQALAQAQGQHSAEVERLRARLAEAEDRARRTMSMAQLTKAGHVYVISNVGTLGMGIFKVGMTRRLEPKERITELGDASVPFPFDVHMMIHCENAPTLENALHRALHKKRVNRANPRKEFFRTDLDEILRIVREHHGEVQYVADAEALEYHQSLAMSEQDAEIIEAVYAAEGDADQVVED